MTTRIRIALASLALLTLVLGGIAGSTPASPSTTDPPTATSTDAPATADPLAPATTAVAPTDALAPAPPLNGDANTNAPAVEGPAVRGMTPALQCHGAAFDAAEALRGARPGPLLQKVCRAGWVCCQYQPPIGCLHCAPSYSQC